MGADCRKNQRRSRNFDNSREFPLVLFCNIPASSSSVLLQVDQASEPTVRAAVDSLRDWIAGAEHILKSSELHRIDHLDVTEAKLDQIKV